MRANFLLLLLLLLLLCPPVQDAQAIVIRHDTGYASHSARESEFPAVFYLEKRRQRRICVATLVHPRWALTAAHCTGETSLSATLARGESYDVKIAGHTRRIDKAILHPAYDPTGRSGDTDLALLRLSEPIDFPRPVTLYRERDELHRSVTLVGWGFFGIGTRGIEVDDGGFRKATNRIESAAGRLRFVFDDPRLGEALDLEGVPGLGDSGGPALLPGSEGWQLAGVAVGELDQGNERQGLYGAVSIYERVSLHLDWIQAIIGDPGSDASD